MQMKALKDFRGREGEGTGAHGARIVEAGCEFTAIGAGRAVWLEKHGLAIPVSRGLAPGPEPRLAVVQNEAAAAGPFVSAGGPTGAEAPASSSPADQALPGRASPRRKNAGSERSPSTRAGA